MTDIDWKFMNEAKMEVIREQATRIAALEEALRDVGRYLGATSSTKADHGPVIESIERTLLDAQNTALSVQPADSESKE